MVHDSRRRWRVRGVVVSLLVLSWFESVSWLARAHSPLHLNPQDRHLSSHERTDQEAEPAWHRTYMVAHKARKRPQHSLYQIRRTALRCCLKAQGGHSSPAKSLQARKPRESLWTIKILFLLFYGSLGSVMPYLPVYYDYLGLPGR